jgi:hypothetical protein
MIKNNGAKALAERLIANSERERPYADEDAAAILGPAGLFIPDAAKHEPYIDHGFLRCLCGWTSPGDPESYFDHITEK